VKRFYVVQKKICLVPSLVVSMDAVVSFVMPVSVVPVDSVDVTGSVDPVVFSCTVVDAIKYCHYINCAGCISQIEALLLMT